jgi:SHS family lactate transporter-like MFS transporter
VNKSSVSDHWSALIAGYLGWTLDAFDFFLVVSCLTAIGREFHKSDIEMAFTLTATLAFRPVGAFLFGLMADRYGRRQPLMIDLIFYSVVEVLSGLAPNYTTFLILRALFGIGMGGEWGVGASLAMEKVPPRLRGVLSGFLQQGYAMGLVLASLCNIFLFNRVGWRPLFFLGGLPALLALFVRMRVKESEVWEKTRHKSWGHLGRAIVSHWKLFLYLVALMTAMNLASHGTQDLYPTFLERQRGFGVTLKNGLSAFSMLGAIIGGTLCGLISDRFGRRRTMAIALLGAVFVIPLWAYAPTVPLLFAGGFLMQSLVQGAWGVIPAHLSELSPDSVRGFLPGFGYQMGVLFSAAIPGVEAAFAHRTSYAAAMSITAVIVFALAAAVTAAGPEHHAAKFGEQAAASYNPVSDGIRRGEASGN